ncbi:MAG: YceI family protein [Methylococcaceae bacterium]|jgi:polyisoprenoid-binding protein YceI
MNSHHLPAVVMFCLLSSAGLAADAVSYTIDPNHTLPVFEVDHLGFSTQRGRFNEVSGSVTLNIPAHTGNVQLTIAAGSIDMGQTKWDEHLKSSDFFNVSRYPTISFTSDKLTFAGDKPVAAEGSLTMLGVTQPVRLTITRFSCGQNPFIGKAICAADTETTLKRSDFGMSKYLPAIGDEIKVRVPVEAYRN